MDVGNNYSVLEYNNISFVYDDIDAANPRGNADLSSDMVAILLGFLIINMWLMANDNNLY